jgi:hypothetical protein
MSSDRIITIGRNKFQAFEPCGRLRILVPIGEHQFQQVFACAREPQLEAWLADHAELFPRLYIARMTILEPIQGRQSKKRGGR